jgi:hypothetical protein
LREAIAALREKTRVTGYRVIRNGWMRYGTPYPVLVLKVARLPAYRPSGSHEWEEIVRGYAERFTRNLESEHSTVVDTTHIALDGRNCTRHWFSQAFNPEKREVYFITRAPERAIRRVMREEKVAGRLERWAYAFGNGLLQLLGIKKAPRNQKP